VILPRVTNPSRFENKTALTEEWLQAQGFERRAFGPRCYSRRSAGPAIVAGHHEMNRLLPFEESTDHAVVMARWIDSQAYEQLHARLVEMHGMVCTRENCVLDGGPEHDEFFGTRE
jgi:hypothetical protein